MADISKITLPNGSSYNIKDATARSSKTNTSVLPNDGGEIKTKFRMSQKGFTNGATWYYPLCKLPKDNEGNYASAILSGRVGGWISNNMSSITSMIWNRGTTGIALLDIAGSANAMSSIWSLCDIVVYTNSDTTDTVYLKCNSYFTFDVDIELFQNGCTILYNGNYVTTTPSGTLAASASTSTKRAELINGKLYVAGNELVFKSAIPTKTSQLTNDSGFKTTDNNTTYSLSKSGSTITLTGSDGKTTSVTDSDTAYTLPAATSSTLGGVKTGSNITNSSGTISLTKANVTAALGYTPPTTNTTYGVATQSANGLMSSSDKTKLDGIATGANKTTVDSALSSTSTNPVQNKVINSALAGKASTAVATQSTNGLMSTADKKKLDGISGNGLRAVIGTYSHSKDAIYIDLGERPKFVIIYGTANSSNTVNYPRNIWICADGYPVLKDSNAHPDRIAYEIRDTGFFVTDEGANCYPNNYQTGPYVYIAFY